MEVGFNSLKMDATSEGKAHLIIATAVFFFLTIEGPFEGSYQMGKFLYGPIILNQPISVLGLTGSVFLTSWFASVVNYVWEHEFRWNTSKKLVITYETTLQKKFALALFITNGLSCVMAVRGQFAGANTFGWSTVALYFLLALGFGAFVLIKPRA